jgi:hypothetical protein
VKRGVTRKAQRDEHETMHNCAHRKTSKKTEETENLKALLRDLNTYRTLDIYATVLLDRSKEQKR